MSVHSDESDSLETIINDTPICFLKPKQFFVAWHGVVTLVFDGWPEPINTMKHIIGSKIEIAKENFGSKFPKVSLGVIKDDIQMTKEMLNDVRKLCEKHTKNIENALNNDNDIDNMKSCFKIDKLNIVLYSNRCQESIICEKVVSLNQNHVMFKFFLLYSVRFVISLSFEFGLIAYLLDNVELGISRRCTTINIGIGRKR